MATLKQSTAFTRMFLMVDSADHITGKTGLTVTATLSKAGAAFGAAGGAVTEVSSGWYKLALSTTDTNTLGDLAYHCTATGADPTDFVDQVTTQILGDTLTASVAGGVTVTTNNDKTGYQLTSGERTSIADALLDRDMSLGIDSGTTTVRTPRQALRALRNKWAIQSGTATIYKEDDTAASWTSTVTTTAGTSPVTSSDPAG